MRKLTLAKCFPFEHIRTAQKNILSKIEPYLTNPKIKYIVIEAETGVGKSAIAKTLSEYYKESYLLTATKSLQEQYSSEFYNFDVKVVKGKSNYVCDLNKTLTCDMGQCKIDPRIDSCGDSCPYRSALKKACSSEMFISSYALFLAYMNAGSDGILRKRKLIVVDECHLIGEQLIELAKLEIDMKAIADKYELIDWENGDLKEIVKWQKKFKADDIENNIDILDIVLNRLEQKLQEVSNNLWKVTDELSKKHMTPSELKKLNPVKLEKEMTELRNLIKNITRYKNTAKNGNWVTDVRKDGRFFYAVPILAKGLFEEYIGSMASSKIVFMSATIFGKENFCKELGLDPSKTLYIQEHTTFDPKRSPIVINPCLSFKMGEYEKSIKIAFKEVKKITDTFSDHKGIIHTGNYKVLNFLMGDNASNRFIYKRGNESNENLILQHVASTENTILASPSMMSGVDLKDDLSRFQIIMKLPYASLGDPRMKYISQKNFDMYAIKMLREFMQACGRSTRNENDWSVTYVLDQAFVRIFNKFKKIAPSLVNRMIMADKFNVEEYFKYVK